jgi:ATP-dependent exoDNAse (exonuclease V) alpha subunit
MAIYHLSVKAISRSAGRSATAAAAYRAATRIEDERTGLVHDYSRKGGVLHREIVAPDDAPAWARDRAQLWNAAELAETRKNSTVAREIEVALPTEISPQHRRELACALAHEIAARHRCAVDLAIHAPARRSDERNHHAHLLMTTRRFNADGLTEKTRELDDLKTGEVTRWRERWATLVNEHLAEHGHTDRVDHRSLEAQGLDRDPTFHKGPAVTAIERRGEIARVTERVHEEVTERLRRATELGRLERESNELARSIIDTSTQLEVALDSRDTGRNPSLEEIRRAAQVEWLAVRTNQPAIDVAPDKPRALDLSGDLAAARRDARDQWLAQRASAMEPEQEKTVATNDANAPSRIVLPDDDRAL